MLEKTVCQSFQCLRLQAGGCGGESTCRQVRRKLGQNVQYRIGAVWRLAGICTGEASAAAIELSLNIERLNSADVLPRADNSI